MSFNINIEGDSKNNTTYKSSKENIEKIKALKKEDRYFDNWNAAIDAVLEILTEAEPND